MIKQAKWINNTSLALIYQDGPLLYMHFNLSYRTHSIWNENYILTIYLQSHQYKRIYIKL